MSKSVDLRLRVHHIESASRANGPGLRTVIWFRGCTLGCPGCYNPETHPARGGALWHPLALFEALVKNSPEIEGLTLSGGEPLQQGKALSVFLEQVRLHTSWSVILFSGFAREEIQRLPWGTEVLQWVDVLIAGRFLVEQRLARGLLGSANKTLHFFTARYTLQDIMSVPEAEVIIEANGEIRLSGIDPLVLRGEAVR